MPALINLVQQNHQILPPRLKLKTDRFYYIEHQGWFFHSRNNAHNGPFETRQLAQLALVTHIKQQNNS